MARARSSTRASASARCSGGTRSWWRPRPAPIFRRTCASAFLPGLEACRIVERSEGRLVRDLHFGNAVIRDCVTFDPLRWICFESEANEQHAGGSLTITIEEPEPGALFLRFAYRTSLPEGGEDGRYAEFVRSAYHQSDIDTVRVIRMIAESDGLAQ